MEAILEQYKLMQISRIKTFGKILAKALKELDNRALSMVSIKDLITLINSLEAKLIRDAVSIEYVTDQRSSIGHSVGGQVNYVKIGLFDQR
jgi:hypothetical protein